MTADITIFIQDNKIFTYDFTTTNVVLRGAFKIGDHVRKKLSENAGEWQGHIVGAYMTNNGIGYAVRSEREKKSVQIYPETALELAPPSHEQPIQGLAEALERSEMHLAQEMSKK